MSLPCRSRRVHKPASRDPRWTLALRTGGSVTLAQRPEGDRQELSVTGEGYLPRLVARAGAPQWSGMLYAKGQSPFHAAVSLRYFELLLRSGGS
jgi:hypothetical protein